MRYRIERDLIEGRVEAEDIPALWDAGMAALLDVDTRGNFTNGCMQDVHWGEGLFGYFPSYTLGAMYAAQWFATIRKQSVSIVPAPYLLLTVFAPSGSTPTVPG